jgi:hypothetical protein
MAMDGHMLVPLQHPGGAPPVWAGARVRAMGSAAHFPGARGRRRLVAGPEAVDQARALP